MRLERKPSRAFSTSCKLLDYRALGVCSSIITYLKYLPSKCVKALNCVNNPSIRSIPFSQNQGVFQSKVLQVVPWSLEGLQFNSASTQTVVGLLIACSSSRSHETARVCIMLYVVDVAAPEVGYYHDQNNSGWA